MSKFQDFFATLNRTRLPYVVLRGYLSAAAADTKQTIVLLTSQVQQIIDVTQVTKLDDRCFKLALGDEENVAFATLWIIPKGMGFFPDRFESELLSRTEFYPNPEDKGGIKIPDSTIRGYAALYWFLFRDNGFADEPEVRKAVREIIEERVGPPMPCRVPRVSVFQS